MSLFKKQDITVKTIAKTLVDGKYIEGTPSTRVVKGNIQPSTPDEKILLEYGSRIKKMCLVVSAELIEINEFVVFNSEDYKIIMVDNFENQKLCINGDFQAIGAILDD